MVLDEGVCGIVCLETVGLLYRIKRVVDVKPYLKILTDVLQLKLHEAVVRFSA